MVLPRNDHALQQEDRRLMRLNNQVKYDLEEIKRCKAIVRKAALNAFKRIEEQEKDNILRGNEKGVRPKSASSGGDSSIRSVERAMARGTQFGYSEENEKAPANGVQYFYPGSEDYTYPTHDSNTLPISEQSREEKPSINPKNNKKFWIKGRIRKRNRDVRTRKRNPLSDPEISNEESLTGDKAREAWMCGCCGKVFSTFQEADIHEIGCIQKAIQKTRSSSDMSSRNITEDNESQRLDKPDSISADKQKQDTMIPEVSTRAIASKSVLDKDYNDDEEYERQQPIDNNLLRDIGLLDESEINNSSAFDASSHKKKANLSHIRSNAKPYMGKKYKTKVRFKNAAKGQESEDFSVETPHLGDEGDILLTKKMKKDIKVTDAALVQAVRRAIPSILTDAEREAERQVKYLVNDKLYYENMAERASMLKAHPRRRFRTDGTRLKDKVQNKFVDAWQLIKEGDANNAQEDQYERKRRRRQKAAVDGEDEPILLTHNKQTHYINVVVNSSRTVVKTELERRATKRWRKNYSNEIGNFDQVRKLAHDGIVQLAKLAVMADFTPRNAAIQLSNNLYRLISPALKRRGVLITTEIEYRVGPYFVLAVNINSIHWAKLIKYSHKLVERRRQEWENDKTRRDNLKEELSIISEQPASLYNRLHSQWCYVCSMRNNEIIANFLYYVYYLPWSASSLICWVLFHWIRPLTIRQYILEGVADEIFSYVEGKGMEMAIQVMPPEKQTAFMLSALRELREGSKGEKKKTEDEKDSSGILGNLLGKTIKADLEASLDLSDIPDNLEYVNMEMDLPIGFQRLRWALLSSESTFTEDVVYAEANYTEVVVKDWNKHNDTIGLPTESMPPNGPTAEDFVGAEIEREYVMPKSTFVKANKVSQTIQIKCYNDSCFCILLRTLTPEVPYGNTFVTWTQILITNTGNNSCHMVCSVEVEFPNGQPMISRQIISGARSGTAIYFVLLGELIIKYAKEYP